MTFDEYVRQFGGEVVKEHLSNHNFDNADYLFRSENVVAEMKCLEKDFFSEREYKKKLNELYQGWVRQGLAPRIFGKSVINTKDLPLKCQTDVANIVKRPVENRIQKANKQIKKTKEHFGLHSAKGLLLLVNDGNYSLESENVLYLVKRIVNTQCTAIDTAIYFTVNMRARVPGVEQDILVWADTHRRDGEGAETDFLNSLRDGWISFLGQKRGEKIPQFKAQDEDIKQAIFIRPQRIIEYGDKKSDGKK